MKKLLYITHLSGRRLNRFWMTAIRAAQKCGFEFHLACNMDEAERPAWDTDCEHWMIKTHQIDFDRNPLSFQNLQAKKQLSSLMEKEDFEIVHCNTPVGGLLGRICAKERKVPKIIYQAHGFHFWKGAPIKNWLFYYPVEKWLARKTDVLITINKEDYALAKQRFKAKKVEYIPGVGIDTGKFHYRPEMRAKKRNEFGLKNSDFVLLSVGELIPRKNHKIVFEALKILKDADEIDNIQYLICGEGILKEKLKRDAKTFGIDGHVKFLGYRNDLDEIYSASDIFVFPSLQEGLPVALMEAMACGLPVLCSNIRGNTDLIENGANGERVDSAPTAFKKAIMRMIEDQTLRDKYSKAEIETVRYFESSTVENRLQVIYTESI